MYVTLHNLCASVFSLDHYRELQTVVDQENMDCSGWETVGLGGCFNKTLDKLHYFDNN